MEQTQGKPSLLGMFTKPGVQFDKVREQPVIWRPLAIITLIYFLASIIMAVALTPEDLVVPGTVTLAEAKLAIGITKGTLLISGIIAPIFGITISTVIYFIITKIAKKDTTFGQLFSMGTFIMAISTAGFLLNNLLHLVFGGPYSVYFTSVAGIMGSDSLVLATLEFFSIWQLALTAIGLHRVGKLSKGAAWTVSILFFFIGLAMALIGEVLTTILEGLK